MTDEEVDTQFTVFAIMLAAPYLNGDHGTLAPEVRDDIQAILWRHGYMPARQMLLESGATPMQVDHVTLVKQAMFGIASLKEAD